MAVAAGKTCPYCQTPIRPGDDCVFCADCCVPHHRECWEENRRCTTFGCRGEPCASPGAGRPAIALLDVDLDHYGDAGWQPGHDGAITAAAIKRLYYQSGLAGRLPAAAGDDAGRRAFDGLQPGYAMAASALDPGCPAATGKRKNYLDALVMGVIGAIAGGTIGGFWGAVIGLVIGWNIV